MKHRYMLCWLGRVARIVQPRIRRIRLGMAFQVKDLYDAIPNRFTVENLFNRHALAVRGFRAMQLVNSLPEFFDMAHPAASSKSPTPQNIPVTPAAIAGVQRMVLCRFTKL